MTPQHQIDDDDIRTMLRSKAAEVRVSEDAWEAISARLQAAPGRPVARRLAVAGVAAAAVAGTVFVANLPGTPTSQVANPTTTEAPATDPGAGLPAHVFAAPAGLEWDAGETAQAYLRDRTGLDAGEGEVVLAEATATTILFRTGPVASEVFLRRIEGRWVVDSAASDLVPLHDPTYEDGQLSAEIGIEADGDLTVTTGGPVGGGDESSRQQPVTRLEQVPVRASLPDRPYVRVSAVLRADDGTVGVSESWVRDHTGDQPDPGNAGEDADQLDPERVASAFLAEALGTASGFGVQAFQQGDNTSGEVPYALADGADGTVLLRRTGGEGTGWFVTAVTSSSLELVDVRREETHLVADVRSSMTGTLTWTGATPVEVRSGQIVSIGRPDTPDGHPVVVRLTDGGRTVALVARLG